MHNNELNKRRAELELLLAGERSMSDSSKNRLILKLLNEELLHAAKDFKELFPDGSQGGKASELIWEDRETFELFNDNFIISIEDIGESINNEDSVSLVENFNIMASNCGTCHKKFRN